MVRYYNVEDLPSAIPSAKIIYYFPCCDIKQNV